MISRQFYQYLTTVSLVLTTLDTSTGRTERIKQSASGEVIYLEWRWKLNGPMAISESARLHRIYSYNLVRCELLREAQYFWEYIQTNKQFHTHKHANTQTHRRGYILQSACMCMHSVKILHSLSRCICMRVHLPKPCICNKFSIYYQNFMVLYMYRSPLY